MKKQQLPFFMALIGLMTIGINLNSQESLPEDLRSGKDFLPVSVYTAEDDQELLKLFAGLRVADVSDGMDKAGLPGVGLVDPSILPLWIDLKNFSHRFAGLAGAARY